MTTHVQSSTQPHPFKAQNLIAVASGKGGVGKTTISIALTQALSRMGQRSLLFDGDLGLANVDVQLALMPKRDLGAVVSGTIALADAIEHYEEGGFDVIAGRSGMSSLAAMPHSRLNDLRQDLISLTAKYDSVVLDLGAGIDATVRHFSGPAGRILVVTTDEPTALTDAYAFIKLTVATNPQSDIRVIVNMAENYQDGERTYQTLLKACSNFLGYQPQLAGVIRRDKKVREAIRAQSSVLTRYPNCEAAADIERITRDLLNE